MSLELRRSQGLDFQQKFFNLFNHLYPDKYHLVPSLQAYEIFDFYLFKKGEVEPFIVELKTRPGKFQNTFPQTLVDYIKILKLRQLSPKAYVIVCFEDVSVILDAATIPDAVIIGTDEGLEKPMALFEIKGLKTIEISLEALRLIK